MRDAVGVAQRPEFSITVVACRDDHRHWSRPEENDDYRIVLVRSGAFRRSVDGTAVDIDRTVGYLGLPDDEERFAHPGGGDVCTSVSLAPELWRSAAGDVEPSGRGVYVDAGIELEHRRILAAAKAGEVDYAVVEHLLALLAAALTPLIDRATPAMSRSRPADRKMASDARRAVLDDDPASIGLLPLADSLGVSPYGLSRAFSREVGVSLSRYRNRVRVGRVLDRIEAGERSLGILAADLGFSDQAHLTRTVRTHVGHTPTALRRLLEVN
jgi:AraC-like DNA-binding protein